MFKEFYNKMDKNKSEVDVKMKEMQNWYTERTNRHINLVRKYIDLLPDMLDSEKDVRKRKHDSSKFKDPELTAYVWISWKYKCLADGKQFDDYNPPSDIDDLMHNATHHHVTNNSHHPEYHTEDQDSFINKEDRDKPPTKIVDATKMPDMDIMEMCADWSAMSEELGKNTPQEWAKSNVNVRWKFTEEQESLIYKTLNSIWSNTTD